MMSTDAALRPVILPSQRPEKMVQKVRDSLTTWAGHYRSGDVLAPKKQVKDSGKPNAKNSDKISYVAGTVKRTNIREKLNDQAETLRILETRTNDPVSMEAVRVQREPLHMTRYMTEINCVGSIVDIATYLSQRLAKSTYYFDLDATLFGIISLLQGATKDPEAYVDLNNVGTSGNMNVLRGFQMYANATSDEAEYDAITTLYNDFVIGVVDKASQIFAERIVAHGGPNIDGQYNSSPGLRGTIFQKLLGDLDEGSRMIYPFLKEADIKWPSEQATFAGPGALEAAKAASIDPTNDTTLTSNLDADIYAIMRASQRGAQIYVKREYSSLRHPTVKVIRSEWLADKGTPKRKSDENQMNLLDIAPFAMHLGVVKEIIALVPAKFRPENTINLVGPNGTTISEKQTSYPLLGLNPLNAHHLIYTHGISFVAKPVDYNAGRTIDANGNTKRLLTQHQALDAIIKRVMGYFDVDKNGHSIIIDLLNRTKFIDISAADFEQNHNYHLGIYTKTSTALLFPDTPPPALRSPSGVLAMGKDELSRRPDLILDLLLYTVGFPSNKVTVNYEQIQSTIKGLYKVFSEKLNYDGGIPTVIQYNSVAVNKASGSQFIYNGDNSRPVSYVAPRGSIRVQSGQAFTQNTSGAPPMMQQQQAPQGPPMMQQQQQFAPQGPPMMQQQFVPPMMQQQQFAPQGPPMMQQQQARGPGEL